MMSEVVDQRFAEYLYGTPLCSSTLKITMNNVVRPL